MNNTFHVKVIVINNEKQVGYSSYSNQKQARNVYFCTSKYGSHSSLVGNNFAIFSDISDTNNICDTRFNNMGFWKRIYVEILSEREIYDNVYKFLGLGRYCR